jgi:hypothetical protein
MMNIEKRGPGRPPRGLIRSEGEPRDTETEDRLLARIREIRSNGVDLSETRDKFWAPPPPDGWDYQWKMRTVMGMEYPERIREQHEQGWTPVPLSRHPEMMPPGWTGATIERDGQALMERPMIFTEEARAREGRDARMNIRSKEEQLGSARSGHFDRDARVKKGYEPIAVPDDE